MARDGERKLSDEGFEMVAEQFKVFAEPMRLKLVYALMEGEKRVSDLVEETGGLQANVSKHLGVLLDAGVVRRRKQGTSSYYSIADDTVYELCDLMCGSVERRLEVQLEGIARS
ncbi:transcriptional regulator, ArsR family [Rubrobacter xylanophilus DSM 9941]|uniref:Transcriptional regulator, ArsR family n=1 Tax=Rubrobacter xylanophilus (strain DSM 9941 / JCM 11954 / NBRC 16129 / PRD-1) TaxID=266117 RepID=Q1AVK8_RUBXD|nr:metalloregulator ArsR/SmtB family transcription factor [Rubrobacter xylanophilus]ABG04570.1 transcriptional regulator, ArsR family [Rubrobacter xylanophilus DSM 9941]